MTDFPHPPDAPSLDILHGFAPIADRFDLVLCDVWGVVHNGVASFAAAAEALTRFRALPGATRQRRVVLLTNAPRPHAPIERQLDHLGVPKSAYDAVVTSGDLTRLLLAARAGAVVHHVGPERDLPLFAGLPLTFGDLESAACIVCTGLFHDERETVRDYASMLERMMQRGLPMICANPDLVVDRGGRMIECAGALGAAYEALGGEVVYAGKPHAPIYDLALERAAAIDGTPFAPGRILAIGDALRTDIAGARGYGLACLMVLQGIHAAEIGGEEPLHAVEEWLAAQAVRPDAVIDRLTW